MPSLTGPSGLSGLSGLIGGGTYIDKVLGYGPIAYWVLNEAAGGTAADQVNSPLQDGAYTGVTLADTLGPDNVNSAPLFDGVNDYVDIYTATLDGVFDGAEGTMAIWARVFNAGVWADGTWRLALYLREDVNNRTNFQKAGGSATLHHEYTAGGVLDQVNSGVVAYTNWFHLAGTWSATADETEFFINGASIGTRNTLGVYVGSLTAAVTNIGAKGQPSDVWHGWLAHCAIWDSVLTGPQILDLATV